MGKARWAKGFTLVEVTIVMAIAGLLLIEVLAGSESSIKVERFSGEIRQIADNLRAEQTQAYSTQTGDHSVCTVVGSCYWRGTATTFTQVAAPSGSYTGALLYGNDLSPAGQFQDPRNGIIGLSNATSYNLGAVELTKITAGTGAPTDPQIGHVSIAFLSPDGKAYGCTTGASCTPNGVAQIYNDSASIVQLYFKDSATSLTGMVTINLANATIAWTVK